MPPDPYCPHFHRAVELVGRRWSGAILAVLLDRHPAPARFSDLTAAVPDLSDRMCAERIRELEQHGLVRRGEAGYALTAMGRDLEPAVAALRAWAQRHLAAR